MSDRNGDKSRFNRERKQKIARRIRTRELLERAAKVGKSAETGVRATAKLQQEVRVRRTEKLG